MKSNIQLILFASSIPLVFFVVIGALLNKDHLLGAAYGFLTFIVILTVVAIWEFGSEHLKKQMEDGKQWAYVLVGILVGVGIGAYFAFTLGNATCTDSDDGPQGGCLEYADDGYKPTDAQRWAKFWQTAPIAVVISGLIGALVHANTHKENKKK